MPRFLDRYSSRFVDASSLPKDIDLGRFADEDGKDLTNRVFSVGNDRYIHQDLLEEKNESLHNLFDKIRRKLEEESDGVFDIYPTVQSLEEKLGLYTFEKYLCDKVQHIEQVCRQPHFLLQRTIEKVNVSKAKRIPAKSYQYLASHTEDWEQKSIIQFKPSRILHEELDINYNVYENQLTLALVDRCLRYLEGRLQEIKALSEVLGSYETLSRMLSKGGFEDVWYEKVHRNFSLVGGSMAVYQQSFRKTLSETDEALRAAYKKLLKCKSSPLFDEVDSRVTGGITLRDTNVLVNHKHYRYIRALWVELVRFHPEKDDARRQADEQDILDGLRSYAKVLLAYTVLNMSVRTQDNYVLDGNYSGWDAIHARKSSIRMRENRDKTLSVTIGSHKIRLVVVGNPPSDLDSLPKGTVVLYYGKDTLIDEARSVRIDPIDADSSERLGKLINRYLLAEYASGILESFPFPQHLRDFVRYLDIPWVKFDPRKYTYSFQGPGTVLNKSCVSSDLVVGRNIRDDQKKDLYRLVQEISVNYDSYSKQRLFCFHCLRPYNQHILETLEYLPCEDDHFVVDFSREGLVVLKNDDPRYEGVDINWGMDCLTVRLDEV